MNKENYKIIKFLCETNAGFLTQFVRATNVIKVLTGQSNDICKNLWLKVNEKLGGTNWKIDMTPLPRSPEPVMVVGCSFSHSPPGEQKPTMVGFVASTGQGATKYINDAFHQDPRLNIVAKDTMKAALNFMIIKQNRPPPSKIIWYRGGASEGQLQMILKAEMLQIREILEEWRPDYKPGITFIAVVRNQRQKLFAANKSDMVGRGENVPCGTAMSGYGGIPKSFHFFLVSHSGIGTLNPTFYQILHDDNDLSMQNAVSMTYALCMDSKRCERR